MADLFLLRENRIYAKYSNCTAVAMTGQVSAWGSVTGVAATEIITVPSSAFLSGNALIFTSLTGGAGLVVNTKYYIVSPSGATFQLATSQGGTAINFTTDITAATVLVQTDELMIWSSEFRDIFTPVGTDLGSAVAAFDFPTRTDLTLLDPVITVVGSPGTSAYIAGTPVATNSDQIAHAALRQTMLARTYWKFTVSVGASPLYAEVLEGDIVANNPPNTP